MHDSVMEYVEHIKLFHEANDIRDTKKVEIISSTMGGRKHRLLQNLFTTNKPSEQSFDEIIDFVKSLTEPKLLIMSEQFQLNPGLLAADETVTQFILEPQWLATHCKFKVQLDHALGDRFVAGLQSKAAQRALLVEADLTFKKAVAIIQGTEVASVNARKLPDPSQSMKFPQEEMDAVVQRKPTEIAQTKKSELT